jgi:hypothetical protein
MIADATIMATTFGLAAGDMIRRCERFRHHIQQTVPENLDFARSAGRRVP